METAEVEIGSEAFLLFGAEGADVDFTELVGQGLSGPEDVAVHFGVDVVHGQRRVLGHVGDRLFLAPSVPMDAGVHHQAERAPHLVTQTSEIAVGIGIEADFQSQPLRIQCPAFGVGGEGHAPAEGMQLELLGEGDLKMMSGHGLVEAEGFDFIQGSRGQVVGVHGVIAGAELLGRTR